MPPIPYPDPHPTDGVVSLRPHRPDDGDTVVEFCDDESILRWIPLPHPYTHADWVQWQANCRRSREEGRELALAIADAEDRPIGNVGFKHLDRPGYTEIGYLMGGPSRGRGYMARALRLARDHAVRSLGVERVELLIHHENAASERVARAAGFAETGEYRPCPTGCTPDQADHKVFEYIPPAPEEA